MLANIAISSSSLSALAKLVSNSGLQRIVFDENFKQYGMQMKRLLNKTGVEIKEKCTFQEIIDLTYNHLLSKYRHEYLYKNALLNSFVLKKYSLADTILLNEFRIGNSKADAVLVNGTNKVFEIKTELDSADRLGAQINDYYKAFSEVYIVVHHTLLHKYSRLVDSKIGIMVFSSSNMVEIEREATRDQSRLDIAVMMKALRKSEYLNVVRNITGTIPDVKPVALFNSCLNVLSQHSSENVQYEFLKVIKQRINPEINKLIVEPNLPESLRFSCYNSDLKQNDYIALIDRLKFQF